VPRSRAPSPSSSANTAAIRSQTTSPHLLCLYQVVSRVSLRDYAALAGAGAASMAAGDGVCVWLCAQAARPGLRGGPSCRCDSARYAVSHPLPRMAGRDGAGATGDGVVRGVLARVADGEDPEDRDRGLGGSEDGRDRAAPRRDRRGESDLIDRGRCCARSPGMAAECLSGEGCGRCGPMPRADPGPLIPAAAGRQRCVRVGAACAAPTRTGP